MAEYIKDLWYRRKENLDQGLVAQSNSTEMLFAMWDKRDNPHMAIHAGAVNNFTDFPPPQKKIDWIQGDNSRIRNELCPTFENRGQKKYWFM